MGATGILGRALELLGEDILRFYNGHELTGATGISRRVLWLPEEDMGRFCNGHVPTVLREIIRHRVSSELPLEKGLCALFHEMQGNTSTT